MYRVSPCKKRKSASPVRNVLRLLHILGLFVKLFQVAYRPERSISWFSPVHGRNILGGHNDNLRKCLSMVFYLHSKITQKLRAT